MTEAVVDILALGIDLNVMVTKAWNSIQGLPGGWFGLTPYQQNLVDAPERVV